MKSYKKSKRHTRKSIEATLNLYKYLYEQHRENIQEDKLETILPNETGE